MDNIWVFGASKPLGRNLSEALSVQYDVVTFGRTPEPQIFGLSKHVDVDFADHVTLRKAILRQGLYFANAFAVNPTLMIWIF